MKQTDKKGLRNRIGGLGELIAQKYLKSKGMQIVQTNYLQKWGEIDIVAREIDRVHFVEVKTVSYETKMDLQLAISRGTWRPEENVHPKKIQRLNRAIESWFAENDNNQDWQIDVVAVRVVPHEKFSTVKYIPNVILG